MTAPAYEVDQRKRFGEGADDSRNGPMLASAVLPRQRLSPTIIDCFLTLLVSGNANELVWIHLATSFTAEPEQFQEQD
jgi:hypothetical protein